MLTAMPRSHYIDRLRVAAVLLLFVYHGGQIFNPFPFYVNNREASVPLFLTVKFLFQWHMHLLFLLAGMASCFSLIRRSNHEYIRERLLRLGVPLVFGILTIAPPLLYLLVSRFDKHPPSYLEFQRHLSAFFTPTGDLHLAHLWFIAYLLIYSGLALPLFRRLSRGAGEWLAGALITRASRVGGVLALGIIPAILEAGLRPRWPGGMFNIRDDWATFAVYFSYFVLGYLLASDERFGQALERGLGYIATLAVGAMAAYFWLVGSGMVSEPRLGDPHPYTTAAVLFQILRGLNSWCWVMMFLAAGRRFWNAPAGRVLNYLKEASYPIYILHATVIMLIAHQVVAWDLGPILKFLIIMALSFPATFIIYDLLVRRAGPTSFLFGMRARSKGP